MDEEKVALRVDCYAGYRGEETPRRFWLGERKIEVTEVVARWQEPGGRYFSVRGDDGVTYVLCHDETSAGWKVISHGGKVK